MAAPSDKGVTPVRRSACGLTPFFVCIFDELQENNTVNKTPIGLTLALAAGTTAVAVPVAAVAENFGEALTGGSPLLDMRLRYEAVDDSVNADARALTLRTRLGYRTGNWNGFYGLGEYEDVRVIGGVDSYAPQRSGHATVADPEVTELNQAYLGYTGFADTEIRAGRQRIILDNARFVGNVGWRQNEQTFGALSVVNTGIEDFTVTYAFIDKINGILTTFDANVSDHILNVRYSGFEPATITGYGYLLEDDDSGAENDTWGIRLKGAHATDAGPRLLYTAEFATQDTNSNDASYGFLEGGLAISGVTVKVGYELLGSDDGAYGFQTPLATKHAFNGWADQFLATPANGLEDLMFSMGGKVAGVELLAVYHDFSADEGGADYGTELDLLAVRKFGKRYALGLKYASYDADTWKTDTDKLWLWAQLKL